MRENGEINFNKRSGDDPEVSGENNKERNKWSRWGIKWLIIRVFFFFFFQCCLEVYVLSFFFVSWEFAFGLLATFGLISLFHELWYRGKGLSDMLVLLANCQF